MIGAPTTKRKPTVATGKIETPIKKRDKHFCLVKSFFRIEESHFATERVNNSANRGIEIVSPDSGEFGRRFEVIFKIKMEGQTWWRLWKCDA